MLRLLPILALAATPAAAGTFTCADPTGEVTLEIFQTYDGKANAFDVASAKFQIVDDLGYTSEDDPSNGGTVTLVNKAVDPWMMNFDFHLVAPDYDNDIASVRLVTLSEGNAIATGGVLRVVAGGVWPVACTETEASR